jgi:hypothetical protein
MALYLQESIPANIDPTPSGTATISAVTVGTTATQLLAANTGRKGFSIFNNSTRTLYLGIGNTVLTTANFFAKVPANTLYEWSLPTLYTGSVFAIANGTNALLQVLELTP